jgi:hypothetical protein
LPVVFCLRFIFISAVTFSYKSAKIFGFAALSPPPKIQAAYRAAFIFGGTKSQDFSSRGNSRSSLKTGGFLHIFTKVLLVKSFASLSCEVAPCGSKDGVVFIF